MIRYVIVGDDRPAVHRDSCWAARGAKHVEPWIPPEPLFDASPHEIRAALHRVGQRSCAACMTMIRCPVIGLGGERCDYEVNHARGHSWERSDG